MKTEFIEPIKKYIEYAGQIDDDAFQNVKTTALNIESHIDQSLLKIGLVGSPGRGKKNIVEKLPQNITNDISLDILTLEKGSDIALNYDAWILIMAADQLGSLKEKEFVSRLGSLAKRNLIIFINNMEKIPDEESDEIMDFAFSLFQKQGVLKTAIFPLHKSAASSEDYNAIKEKILLWLNELEEIRTDAIKAQLSADKALLKKISSDSSQIINTLEALREKLNSLGKTMQVVKDYMKASTNEIATSINEKFEEEWSVWCEQMTGTNQAKADFISKQLDQWMKIGFKNDLENALGGTLNKISEILPSTATMMDETGKNKYADKIQLAVDIQTEAVGVEERRAKNQKNITNITISMAIAGVGLLIKAPPVMAIGGAAVFFLGSEKILSLLPKQHQNEPSYFDKWLKDVRSQVKEENKKECQKVIDSIVQKFADKESTDLNAKIIEAESTAQQRKDALLKQRHSSELLKQLEV